MLIMRIKAISAATCRCERDPQIGGCMGEWGPWQTASNMVTTKPLAPKPTTAAPQAEKTESTPLSSRVATVASAGSASHTESATPEKSATGAETSRHTTFSFPMKAGTMSYLCGHGTGGAGSDCTTTLCDRGATPPLAISAMSDCNTALV